MCKRVRLADGFIERLHRNSLDVSQHANPWDHCWTWLGGMLRIGWWDLHSNKLCHCSSHSSASNCRRWCVKSIGVCIVLWLCDALPSSDGRALNADYVSKAKCHLHWLCATVLQCAFCHMMLIGSIRHTCRWMHLRRVLTSCVFSR